MMKKYFLLPLLIALIPNMVFGASARYSKLLHEKQRKMEQLEKCMGASKGLQVAGVSTLGLTAVGVAGNIWEAQTIKDNESTIDKNKKNIDTLEKQIQKKKDEKAAKEAEQQQVKSDTQTSEINNFKTSEDLEIFINTLSLGDVTIGSSLSIPTDLLSTEGVSEKINNWKDLCDAVCHEEGALCASEKVDEKTVGENTVYTCLIDTCKEEGVKFKKSEDGLKCELIEEESDDGTDTPNKSVAEECKSKVLFAAGQKWSFGEAVNASFRDMANEYELAVEDDTEIYNRYKNQRQNEILNQLNEASQRELDEIVFDENTDQTITCNYISVNSRDCLGKTLRQCNESVYECSLDVAKNGNKLTAEQQAEEEYKTELVNMICKG